VPVLRIETGNVAGRRGNRWFALSCNLATLVRCDFVSQIVVHRREIGASKHDQVCQMPSRLRIIGPARRGV
jgi:hypothetical protein